MSSGNTEIISRGVFVQSGRLLVCHTKGAANTYLPGGHVDFGEDGKFALKREIDEELGLEAAVGRFIGVCEHAFVQKGEKHCEVNLVFEMEVAGLDAGKEPESMEDYIEFLWIDLDQLADSNLEPASLRCRLNEWLTERDSLERWVSNVEASQLRCDSTE